jgi:hypothetical protein
MSAPEPNGEFSFRCFDCGSYVESWHLAEMLDFSDRHVAVCDGRTEATS